MKPHLQKATPDDVKILMTNGAAAEHERRPSCTPALADRTVLLKEPKSTFGFAQYRFRKFTAVQAWGSWPSRP